MKWEVSIIPKPKIFYGWWIVAVSLIVLFITLGLGYYSFGVFLKPLAAEFGWNRAMVSGAMSIFLLAWGLVCPFVGRLADRYGPRMLVIVGTIALGISFCLLNLTSALWHLYLLYACAGAASATCSEIPVSAAVSNWFRKKRGIAMGITASGIGFGGLLLAPLVGFLILNSGWQTTYFFMGLLTWAVILPLVIPLMKTRPQEMGLFPDGDRDRERLGTNDFLMQQNSTNSIEHSSLKNSSTAELVKRKELWLVGFAFSLVSFGIIGVVIHEVPFMIDMGIPMTTAATMLGLTAGIGIVGKLGFGYLTDKMSPKWVALACIAMQSVGVVILLQSRTLGMVWAFIVVFAFASGGMNTLRPLVIGEFFGTDSFGKVFGLTELMRRFGSAGGPFIAGYIFDTTGSYHYAFVSIIAAYLLGMLALFLACPVKQNKLISH
ncbi:MFS transporter [Chloroflexota bacterium]